MQHTIQHTHIFEKIPEQVQNEQKVDPTKGTTKLRFNNFAQSPYYEKAITKLFRLPGNISKIIVQLLTGWTWLNNTGKRYQLLDSADCPVCKKKETVQHYLFECDAFTDHRQVLQHNLRNIDTPFDEKTLFGLRNFSFLQLQSIFLSLYDYVSHTKRKKIGYTQNLEKWHNIMNG